MERCSGTFSITVWSRARTTRIWLSLHINDYPNTVSQKSRHRRGSEQRQITKDSFIWHCIDTKIQLSLVKSAFLFISLLRISVVHGAWTCITGLECKWAKVCIMFLASQTVNLNKTCSSETSLMKTKCFTGFSLRDNNTALVYYTCLALIIEDRKCEGRRKPQTGLLE